MIRSREAREKAKSIIQMYGISSAPVNVDEVALNLGFEVIPFEFAESISGYLRILNSRKVIGVNKKDSSVRRRFSVAHELGHYLSGHEDYSPEGTNSHIDYTDNKRYSDPSHRMEVEADEFAAELLMPEAILKKEFIELKGNVTELANKFQVSEQAMTIQLVNLKLVITFLGRSQNEA